MKKIILGALIAVLITPSASLAFTPLDTSTIDVSQYTTTESLEELRITLIKQIIVLLQLRIQELIALRDGTVAAPLVLGVTTSTGTVTVAETEVNRPRRSGGGGGGGSSSLNQAAAQLAALNQLQQQVDALLAELGQLEAEQTTIEGLQALILSLETSLAERDVQISDYEIQIDALNDDIDRLIGDKVALDERVNELQRLNNTLRQIIIERDTEAVTLAASIAELEQRQATSVLSIAELTATRDTLQSTIDSLETEIVTLQESGSNQAALIANLQTQQTTLEGELSLERQTNAEQVSGLESAITTLQSEIVLINESLVNRGATITTLETQIQNLETSLSERDSLISSNESQIEALRNGNEDLIEREAALEATIATQQTLIADRDAEVQLLNDTNTELQLQLSQNQASATLEIEDLTSEIADLETQLLELEDAHTELVASLVADMLSVLDEIENVQESSVATETVLNETIAALQVQLAAQQDEIQAINIQLADWRTIALSQSSVITDLLAIVSDLEEDREYLERLIANLEEQIDNLDEAINNPDLFANCELPSTNVVGGATFTFCSENSINVVGEEFVVLVGVDSPEISANAVLGLLQFDPAYLQVNTISKHGSDFSVWTTEPTFSNLNGTILFGAGSPSPFQGTATILAVAFTPLQIGTTIIGVSNDSEILAADGRGTEIYVESISPSYTFAASAPYEATLEFELSLNNPDATTIAIDTDSSTNNVTIFVFELAADDGPVYVNEAVIRVDTSGGIVSDIVSDADLVVDGATFRRERVELINADPSAEWWYFELDRDITFDEGDQQEVELVVDFNRQEGNYEIPQFIQASIDLDTRSLWTAEGSDDLNPDTDYVGTAIGETHTLMPDGLLITGVETSTEVMGENGTVGQFTIEFEVTAFEDDFYFTDNTGTSGVTNGIQYRMESAGTGAIQSLSAVVTSTAAKESNGVYSIREGETEIVTLQVTATVTAAGMYRLWLEDLFFTNDFNGVSNTRSAVITDPVDLRTNYQAIQQSFN